VSVATLLACVALLPGFNYGSEVRFPTMESSFAFGLADLGFTFQLGADSITLWMILLTVLLVPLALLASFESIKERPREYYAWMLVLLAAMNGVFLARDLLLFYVFFELTLVPMFFIIGIWGGPDRRYAAAKFFLLPARPKTEATAARSVGFDDALARLDEDAAGREIRTWDEIHELLDRRIWVLDQVEQRRTQFIGIVRGDIGRHTDGDAGRAVGEQIWEIRRKYDRLLVGAVVGRAKIDRIFVNTVEQRLGNERQAALGGDQGGEGRGVNVEPHIATRPQSSALAYRGNGARPAGGQGQ